MAVVTVEFEIEGVSPISFGKKVPPKEQKESDDAHEARVWRERVHHDKEGNIFIPQEAVKLALEEAAKYRGERVQGMGSHQWGKYFKSGIISLEDMVLCDGSGRWKFESLKEGEEVFVPSDGRRGGSKRVWKTFPVFTRWAAKGKLFVVEPLLQEPRGLL